MEFLRVRLYFLRLLALVHLIAFLSLLAQLRLLIGQEGLLPADRFLATVARQWSWWQAPTLFVVGSSDTVLVGAASCGVLLSLALCFGVWPRLVLILLWGLYLSFVTVGQVFFAFQWDNLLLEATFFAVFVSPWRGQDLLAKPPHRAACFLMLWLVVRLHVESGLAKWLSGDPSWRDLTAMATYYETAPLPTQLAWYAHQLPLWVQRVSSACVLFAETLLPIGLFGPKTLRRLAVAALVSVQLAILATANYGFFNYLTIALCLWGLNDHDLRCLLPRAEWAMSPRLTFTPERSGWFGWIAALAVAGVSLLPFAAFVPGLQHVAVGLRRAMEPWRTINAYHLFASMTYVRREAVLEVSSDGETWKPLEFHYKPGDPARAPRVVAPHQPRIDFQLWFLLLRGEPRAPYFFALLEALLARPAAVADLFVNFAQHPAPRCVRVVVYRYRFTNWQEGWTGGAWWQRERLGESRPLCRSATD